ncbi:hypothetical protein [Streptomyces sp. NPDC102437]|uniref:hypothetical protein n=1 Tax=Streptomyces sp. NPDC102437 TaxID=3366175 RepID=UPI0037FCD210
MSNGLRDVDEFLADVDALLATPPTPAASPAPDTRPEPEAPAASTGDETWEAITAGRRTQPAGSVGTAPAPGRAVPVTGRSGRLPDWRSGQTIDLSKPAEPEPTEPEPTEPTEPEPGEESEQPAAPTSDDTPAPGHVAEEDAPAPAPSRTRLIATTVQEWRPPDMPRGKGWMRPVAYIASGILCAGLTGCTRGVYDTLTQISVNPDHVAGISLSAAMAILMVDRSKKTFIILGAALALVLVIQYVSLPAFVGGLATLLVWGLDQRARTMRQPIAWTVRTAFSTVALATIALVWTTVVHFLTGAAQ